MNPQKRDLSKQKRRERKNAVRKRMFEKFLRSLYAEQLEHLAKGSTFYIFPKQKGAVYRQPHAGNACVNTQNVPWVNQTAEDVLRSWKYLGLVQGVGGYQPTRFTLTAKGMRAAMALHMCEANEKWADVWREWSWSATPREGMPTYEGSK